MVTKINIFALQTIFRITPLNWDEWVAVLYFSFPVIILDEVLKFVSRCIGKYSSKYLVAGLVKRLCRHTCTKDLGSIGLRVKRTSAGGC